MSTWLRDNTRRARAARLVFLALAAASGLLLLLSLVLPSQSEVEMDGPTALAYMGYGVLCFLNIGLLIGSYVAIILWLRRAYYNLHQLPGIYPEYSDGWAAGAWFVPFLNLWRPYTIMREVWNDTQRAARGLVAEPDTVLGWWWAVFVLKLVVGRITAAMQRNSGDGLSSQDLTATALDAAAQLLTAAFTWYVIGRMARFEEQLALRQQVEQLGQPTPAEVPAFLATEQPNYGQVEGY